MNMRTLRLGLSASGAVAMSVVACGLALPAASSAATPATVEISYPVGELQPQIGQRLSCEGSLDNGEPVTAVEWRRGSATGALLSSDAYYAPVAADLGKTLVCVADQTGVTGSASTGVVLPLASVTTTNNSSGVSGDLGETVADVTVTATLLRTIGAGTDATQVTVATTTTTDASGDWSLVLGGPGGGPQDAFSKADSLQLTYAAPPGASTVVPASSTITPLALTPLVAADGSSVEVNPASAGEGVNCPDISFLVAGAAYTTQSYGDCEVTPATPIASTDATALRESGTTLQNDEFLHLTQTSQGFLPGQGDAPTCSADLVSGLITCADLGSGSFQVADGGGAAAALTPVAGGSDEDAATLGGLASGDVLSVTGVGGDGSTVATLSLSTLRVVNGVLDCTPFEALSGENDTLCPASGVTASDPGPYGETDPASGGTTVIDVPSLLNPIPAASTILPSAPFAVFSALQADNALGAEPTAQVVADVTSVAVTITPRDSATPVYDETLTPTSDAVGPYVTGAVPTLTPGQYIGTATLTDDHGDQVTGSEQFEVAGADSGASAAPGTSAAAGPTGASAPAGTGATPGAHTLQSPAGTSPSIRCVTKHAKGTQRGRKGAEHQACSAVLVARSGEVVTVEISRGATTFATVTRRLSPGHTTIRLSMAHPLRRGSYLVTVVARRAGKTTVTRQHETLGN
jgi:hypothetical protein